MDSSNRGINSNYVNVLLLFYVPVVSYGLLTATTDLIVNSGWRLVLTLFACAVTTGPASDTLNQCALFIAYLQYLGFSAQGLNLTVQYSIWYLFRLCLPILGYVRGIETDDNFLANANKAENDLWLYLLANGIARLAYLFWSLNGALSTTTVVIVAGLALAVLPLSSRNRLLLAVSTALAKICLPLERCNIRCFFIALYEPILETIIQWERCFVRTNVDNLPPHSYKPLLPNHIRLLRLERRLPFSPLRCSLHDSPLYGVPPYEAVSYGWAGESTNLSIGGRRLTVPNKIERFLWQRRSIFEAQYFWIDSICINQKDPTEKSAQIPLMRDIYSNSSRVLVWLDRRATSVSNGDLRDALRFLELESLTCRQNSIENFKMHFGSRREDAPFKALRDFFTHSWFEWIWIVQEVATGKKVHVLYGGVRVDWSCVERAVATVHSNRQVWVRLQERMVHSNAAVASSGAAIPRGISNVLSISSIRKTVLNSDLMPLATVLSFTTGFHATDQRDKIFAIVGITRDNMNKEISSVIDYTKSPEEVLILAARYILSTPQWHTLLYFCGRGYPSYFGGSIRSSLPSWVPQWQMEETLGARLLPEDFTIPAHSVLLTPRELGKVTGNSRVIRVRAKQFDVVQQVGPGTGRPKVYHAPKSKSGPGLEDWEAFFEVMSGPIRDWYLQSRNLARQYSAAGQQGRQVADEEFWQVCMNEATNKDAEYLSHTRNVYEKSCLNNPEEAARLMLEDPSFGSLWGELPKIMQDNFPKTVTGRAFAVTASGKMALVPPLSSQGDLLCYIQGTLFPFVLRRHAEGHELMGTCYVHGCPDVHGGSDWVDFDVV
jgi:Heterokaryon incompatibility protein (HET)